MLEMETIAKTDSVRTVGILGVLLGGRMLAGLVLRAERRKALVLVVVLILVLVVDLLGIVGGREHAARVPDLAHEAPKVTILFGVARVVDVPVVLGIPTRVCHWHSMCQEVDFGARAQVSRSRAQARGVGGRRAGDQGLLHRRAREGDRGRGALVRSLYHRPRAHRQRHPHLGILGRQRLRRGVRPAKEHLATADSEGRGRGLIAAGACDGQGGEGTLTILLYSFVLCFVRLHCFKFDFHHIPP
mmetsp:Transcript_24277/g.78334  ORF Transcript_24277/g.78334 Transcript_24277/m.78334 type:complete len:244 (-) Transcript_24277:162-893(-)